MKTIAVCMIVKNEEALLSRALESVKDADAIYICDTGSQDKTLEVAKKYTDNICTEFTWCDSFEKARNHVKSHAKEDYILSIDADEYCHDFSRVRNAIESGVDAINVNMQSENRTHKADFIFPRLFRNAPHIKWEGAIHNHLSLMATFDSDVFITFGSSPAHELDPDRALRILEKEVAKEPTLRELYYLGREYFYKSRYQEAASTLGKYVQTAYFEAEKADAFLIMARCYSTMGMDDDARDACLQAISINSNFKEAVQFMGGISKDYNAPQWYEMAKTANNRNVLFVR